RHRPARHRAAHHAHRRQLMVATATDAAVQVERFAAMGTRAEVQVVDGPPWLAARARARIEALEARWSRFRSGSEVAALNRCAGTPVPVTAETLLLVERALAAASATEGRYDPTVGAAVIAHGYDRTFPAVADAAREIEPIPVVDGAWPLVVVDRTRGTVALPEGTTFDPGGIGKGLAADLVATELRDQAAGVLVNLGGDLRACGAAPTDDGWVITVEDPFDPARELARLAIAEGAVATSSRCRRRWSTATGEVHHLIDPRTGTSARTGVAAVTVVAAEAWWAEVSATSLFLLGPDGVADADASVAAIVVADDGTVRTTAGLEGVLR
ncbi:MAG: FAD:protein FMN transferase, partial [Acidimicrobiales bacterium]|nr:FAD:protein FMN transferase [Acidimicrobiales bacterium]